MIIYNDFYKQVKNNFVQKLNKEGYSYTITEYDKGKEEENFFNEEKKSYAKLVIEFDNDNQVEDIYIDYADYIYDGSENNVK